MIKKLEFVILFTLLLAMNVTILFVFAATSELFILALLPFSVYAMHLILNK